MTDSLSKALETIARLGAKYPPACPLCNDTGEQRYWEGRWRDEAAENERLRAALHSIAYGTETTPAPDLDQCINIARNTLIDGTVPKPTENDTLSDA